TTAALWSRSRLLLFASKTASMVSASSASRRFPRPACRCCRTRPIVSSAPIKPSAGKTKGNSAAQGAASSGATSPLPLNRYVLFLSIAASGLAADLLTKQAIFRWLGIPSPYLDKEDLANHSQWGGDPNLEHLKWLWDQRFGFQTSINTGALF